MMLAAHQPNFIPWLSYFGKLHCADIFVILTHCQFEKNGWQNRCHVSGNYWTKPVKHGLEPIGKKTYADGQNLLTLNMMWINTMAKTLNIDTAKLHMDFDSGKQSSEHLVALCHYYGCNQYLTNPSAEDKYLDVALFKHHNIEIVPFKFPYNVHTFEAFEQWGIEKTTKLLDRERTRCRASINS